MAEKLTNRLADLDAAATIYDLVVQKPIKLVGAQKGQLSLELTEGVQLVFSANHNAVPLRRNGTINWRKVARIKIMRIGNIL